MCGAVAEVAGADLTYYYAAWRRRNPFQSLQDLPVQVRARSKFHNYTGIHTVHIYIYIFIYISYIYNIYVYIYIHIYIYIYTCVHIYIIYPPIYPHMVQPLDGFSPSSRYGFPFFFMSYPFWSSPGFRDPGHDPSLLRELHPNGRATHAPVPALPRRCGRVFHRLGRCGGASWAGENMGIPSMNSLGLQNLLYTLNAQKYSSAKHLVCCRVSKSHERRTGNLQKQMQPAEIKLGPESVADSAMF